MKSRVVDVLSSNFLYKFISENRWIVLITLFFVAGQLLFARAPFVNLEYLYAGVAETIESGQLAIGPDNIGFYIKDIANPILTSVLMVPGIFLFGKSEMVFRLPIILFGVALILLSYYYTKRLFSRTVAVISSALIATNALFWNFSGMAYTDIPFVFFTSVAIGLLYFALVEERMIFIHLSALLLCLAFLTKYVAAIFFVFAFLIVLLFSLKKHSVKVWNRRAFMVFSARVLKYYWPFVAFFVVVCGSYVFWMVSSFGFLIHPVHSGVVFWSWSEFFTNYINALAGYLSWMATFGCFIVAFSIYDFVREVRRRRTMLLLLLFIILADAVFFMFFYKQLGELDFGFIDLLFPAGMALVIRFLLLLCGEFMVLDLLIRLRWSFRKSDFKSTLLKFWVIFVLVVLPIARPTQRYLLVILPPIAAYLAFVVLKKDGLFRLRRLALLLTLLVFIILSLFISFYRCSLGIASADVVGYINEHNIDSRLDWEPKSHAYYLLDNKTLYPFDDPELVLYDTSRPYYTAPRSSINESEYYIVHSVPVKSFGITMKELVVAKKIDGVG